MIAVCIPYDAIGATMGDSSSGAEVSEPGREGGEGRPAATVSDADGSVLRLIQDREVVRMAETKTASERARSDGFTAEERAAMKERSRELKARGKEAQGEREVLAKITEMSESDRVMAERLHALVRANAPDLSPRTWYGMPAYAKEEKVLCFFKPAGKFKTRYATLGFSDRANLDEGAMWPVEFALTAWTGAEEKRISELVKRAMS